MRMAVGCWGRIDRKRATPAVREGAKDALEGVVEPNLSRAIYADTGSVRTTATARCLVGIFSYPTIGARTGFRDDEFTNCSRPPLGPPDVAVGVYRDQVRGEITCRASADLVLLQLAPRGVLANQRHCRVILREPDIVGLINGYPIRLAIRSGRRDLHEGMIGGIEAPDFIAIMLGEPDHAIVINGDAPRARTGGGNGPLLEGIVAGVEHANGVVHRHRKPDVALAVDGQE